MGGMAIGPIGREPAASGVRRSFAGSLVAAALVAALCVPTLALGFDNTEPLAANQWYLEQDHAWDDWSAQPHLAPVKVAVIDTGIDYGHPEFQSRIAAGRSFTSGSWKTDNCGHGTFVAGIIAADPSNGVGIAGIAFNAELLIAKIARPDCTISADGEAKAIYWAVNQGARVINLSIGGVRDPGDPLLDRYSQAEWDAVEFANQHGVLVVAAAGNGPESPSTPWRFAAYPSALPHVLGVAALRQNGSVPDYSNRDALFVDIAAPGDRIFSTVPRNLVDTTDPSCAGQAYSNCGPLEYRTAIGTSFAAPQVTAAAALLLGVRPTLAPMQVEWLLERSAQDVTSGNGCAACPAGRDSLTGWGRLDVAAALADLTNGTKIPAPDAYEPNDNAGTYAYPLGRLRTITASLDLWDDPIDVYSTQLAKGEQLFAHLSSLPNARLVLVLWKPGTTSVNPLRTILASPMTVSVSVSGQQRLSYVAPAAGTYYLEAKVLRQTGAATASYRLGVAETTKK